MVLQPVDRCASLGGSIIRFAPLDVGLVPLWTLLFWPIVMLMIAGSRLGYAPKFDARYLAQIEYRPEWDGVTPAALKRKMKPPRPLAQSERLLYWISMVGGAILWLGFALTMLMLVLD